MISDRLFLPAAIPHRVGWFLTPLVVLVLAALGLSTTKLPVPPFTPATPLAIGIGASLLMLLVNHFFFWWLQARESYVCYSHALGPMTATFLVLTASHAAVWAIAGRLRGDVPWVLLDSGPFDARATVANALAALAASTVVLLASSLVSLPKTGVGELLALRAAVVSLLERFLTGKATKQDVDDLKTGLTQLATDAHSVASRLLDRDSKSAAVRWADSARSLGLALEGRSAHDLLPLGHDSSSELRAFAESHYHTLRKCRTPFHRDNVCSGNQ